MPTTVNLPFLDITGDLTPKVIAAIAGGAIAARDPADLSRIVLTFATQAAANAFNASISLPSQRRYWGVSTKPTLDAVDIATLGNSETADSFVKTIIYDATGGRYPYYAYPASWGTPDAITVGGLAFSDVVITDVADADGTDLYRVIRLNYLQNGSRIVVSWA